MIQDPLVSVCIPAFEQPLALRHAVESTLAQTYKRLEIIITDDSRDSSVGDLVKTLPRDKRLMYKKNEVPKGTPGNWNEAAGLAQGEFIKIIHHDDWFTQNNSLEHFVRLLQDHPDCAMAFSSTSVCSPQGVQKKIHTADQKTALTVMRDPRFLIWANLIGGPSAVIVRRSAFIPFDLSLQWLVDVAWYISILNKNGNIVFSPLPLVATTDGSPQQVTYSTATREVRIREWLTLYRQWNPRVTWSELPYFQALLRNVPLKVIKEILGPYEHRFPFILKAGMAWRIACNALTSVRRRVFRRNKRTS